MDTPISQSTRDVGFWSAVLATVFSLVYVVAQLVEWMGWLGSAGGPESASTPFGQSYFPHQYGLLLYFFDVYE